MLVTSSSLYRMCACEEGRMLFSAKFPSGRATLAQILRHPAACVYPSYVNWLWSKAIRHKELNPKGYNRLLRWWASNYVTVPSTIVLKQPPIRCIRRPKQLEALIQCFELEAPKAKAKTKK